MTGQKLDIRGVGAASGASGSDGDASGGTVGIYWSDRLISQVSSAGGTSSESPRISRMGMPRITNRVTVLADCPVLQIGKSSASGAG